MSKAIVPISIKPHLVPFLFQEFKAVNMVYEGREIQAARVNNTTLLGKFIRLLLEKSNKKPECDTNTPIFLLVDEHPKMPLGLKGAYRFADGRSSFLHLPVPGVDFLNQQLEKILEVALMYYLNSWHEKKGDESLDQGIIRFFKKYNLEEFNYNIPRIRREYYRKLADGYFTASLQFNPISHQVE